MTTGVSIDIQTRKFESSDIIVITRNGGSVFINGYNNKIKFKDLEQYLKMN